ncbi:MAG: riboflavin-specific deaminase-like protein [Glaciecola sp.]|jgi:riboflavin-specific deaminase-like protein
MRQWMPEARHLEDEEIYLDVKWAEHATPRLALNMVVGLDGGVTLDGRSGPVGGEADRAAFAALRDAADVILVGAGTARAENYGPPVRGVRAAARRIERGQLAVPTLAIVTASVDLLPTHRVFADPGHLPLIVTSAAAPEARVASLRSLGVEVLVSGEQEVDLVGAIKDLGTRGLHLLCEGGPRLNTALFDAGLVDEVFVTLAPLLTGSEKHLVTSALRDRVDLTLMGVIEAGSELLLRYQVAR